MLDSYTGFYYIEGDSTANIGKIGKTFGFNEDISNNLSDGVKVTYNDIISKFTNPISLGYTNGLYSCKFLVEENSSKTRKNVNTSDIMWRKVFAIANYLFNKFYAFANLNFEDYQGYQYLDFINGVLTKKYTDPNIQSNSLFDIYVDNSLEYSHLSDNVGETYYYKLKKFKFKIAWNNDVIEIEMWVNPQAFKSQFKSESPFVYIYYNEDISSQNVSIQEISSNIASRYVGNYKQISIPAKLVSNGSSLVVNVPFHIWSSDSIPDDVVGDSSYLRKIQELIKSNENTLSSVELVERWPTIFDEEERIIYPLIDNGSINEVPYSSDKCGDLVVNPISVSSINELINNEPSLESLSSFESATINVSGNMIPFIVGGVGEGALTDKVPFYRPEVSQISALSEMDYDTTRISAAENFVKYLSAIMNHQLSGNVGVLDIPDYSEIEFYETDEYAAFKFLGIVWKVINRNYNPGNLGN